MPHNSTTTNFANYDINFDTIPSRLAFTFSLLFFVSYFTVIWRRSGEEILYFLYY